MKTTTRNLIVAVVFMLGTIFNYANVGDIIKNGKFVRIIFENVTKGNSLTIQDNLGTVLHKESVSKNGELIKFFDFSSLKDGNYKIEVDKDFEISIKYFEVKNSFITFKENNEKVIFKPVIKNKDSKVLISNMSFDKSPLNVTIYFGETVILKETISSEEYFVSRIYKLDASEKGAYKVVVTNNNKSYIKDFSF